MQTITMARKVSKPYMSILTSGGYEDYISAESLVECIHGLPVKSIEFFTAENQRKEAWSRVLHRHWKRRGGILGGTWLADQLHQTFFWVYNIISVCLERYRSNMWYRPGQNERMQRSSAPASSSSCSGFFYFLENLYSQVALRIHVSIETSKK